jgi:hypothetical protein
VVVHHHLALHDFWLLVWLLKSLWNFVKRFEGFWFEFKRKKFDLKRVWEKKKKRKLTYLPSQPSGSVAHLPHPAVARHPHLLYLFPVDADDWAPPVSLSPPPFLSSSSPRCPADPAPPCDPRRARPPLHLPFLSPRPIKSITLPWSIRSFPSLSPSRDGCGHQWQAPPLGVRPPRFAFFP